jgi:hypothetical protein
MCATVKGENNIDSFVEVNIGVWRQREEILIHL